MYSAFLVPLSFRFQFSRRAVRKRFFHDPEPICVYDIRWTFVKQVKTKNLCIAISDPAFPEVRKKGFFIAPRFLTYFLCEIN